LDKSFLSHKGYTLGRAVGHIICHANDAWTNTLMDVYLTVSDVDSMELVYINTTAHWYTQETWTTWGEIEWRNVIRVLNLNSEFYRDSYFEGSRTDFAEVNTSTSVIKGCDGDYLRIDMSSKYSICTVVFG
jgi:hypothetical protein